MYKILGFRVTSGELDIEAILKESQGYTKANDITLQLFNP